MQLILSSGDEPFRPIGAAEGSFETTKKGEVVYRDDTRILTRAWNHRDCDETKIQDETVDFAIFVEDLGEDGDASVGQVMEDLKGLYEKVFGKAGELGGRFSGETKVLVFKDGMKDAEATW